MSVFRRLAALTLAVSILSPTASFAIDDSLAAESSAPTAIKLCGDADDDPIKPADCKEAGYDRLVARIDKTFATALAKAPINVRPLLKRDQNWFNQVVLSAAESIEGFGADEDRETFADTLRARTAMLEQVGSTMPSPGNAREEVTARSPSASGTPRSRQRRACFRRGPRRTSTISAGRSDDARRAPFC